MQVVASTPGLTPSGDVTNAGTEVGAWVPGLSDSTALPPTQAAAAMTDSLPVGNAGDPSSLHSWLEGRDPLTLDYAVSPDDSLPFETAPAGSDILDAIVAIGSQSVSPGIAFVCMAGFAALVGQAVLMGSLSAAYSDCLAPTSTLAAAKSALTALRPSVTEQVKDVASPRVRRGEVLGELTGVGDRPRSLPSDGSEAAPLFGEAPLFSDTHPVGKPTIKVAMIAVSLLALSLATLPSRFFQRVIVGPLPGDPDENEMTARICLAGFGGGLLLLLAALAALGA